MSSVSARCASCNYPLNISDCVVCYECSSYFHIDCAQLVGFPYYELSSDPHRNTFHCFTCKLLPLPRRQSDSESDDEMPSRQLDYSLEAGDFSKDMNEVKGSVQDLSDLCKDMLREINELKSVNLTLRCCVENLRHDNEERDRIIANLSSKLNALEKKTNSVSTKTNCIEGEADRISLEREEDTERYMTPEPECAKLEDLENQSQKNVHFDHKTADIQSELVLKQDILSEWSLLKKELGLELEAQQLSTESKIEIDHLTPQKESVSVSEIDQHKGELEEQVKREEKDILLQDLKKNEEIPAECSEFESKAKEEKQDKVIEDELNAERNAGVISERENAVKNWGWEGNDAVQLNKIEEVNEIELGENEREESEGIDAEAQGWEMLTEEMQNESKKIEKDLERLTDEGDLIEEDEGIDQEQLWTEEIERSTSHYEKEEWEKEDNEAKGLENKEEVIEGHTQQNITFVADAPSFHFEVRLPIQTFFNFT